MSTQKAHDLRRFLSRHAKSNSIDAHTLARSPLIDPAGVRAVALPDSPAAAVRRDRLVGLIARAATTTGTRPPRPTPSGRPLETRWRHGDDPAISFDALADEIATEVRVIAMLQGERDRHATARETAYVQVDVDQLARSLPGIANVGGPMLVAVMGDPARSTNAAAFKSYLGLAPKASETGATDRKGQPMSKAGNRRLRTQLLRSADTARQIDPQLAAVYHDQMVAKGAVHTKALAVVAARLAERAWTVMSRGTSYEIRDLDGTPVTRPQARQIIADTYTVPEQIRQQRRSKKGGRAPHQVLEGRASGQRSKRDNARRPSHNQGSLRPRPTSTLTS